MKEKKQIATMWILTVLIVILIAIIVGLYVKLVQAKKEVNLRAEQQAEQMQQSNVQNNVETAATTKENKTSTTQSGKSDTTKVKTLDGTYLGNGDFFTDAGSYIFNTDGTVTYAANHYLFGTYVINGSKVVVTFTEMVEPGGTGDRIPLEENKIENFTIKDDNTLLVELENGSKYEYFKEIVPTLADIYGTWKVYFGVYDVTDSEYLEFKEDGTYKYLITKHNSTTGEDEEITDTGTFSLREKTVVLKSSNGESNNISYSRGRYLLFSIGANKVFEKTNDENTQTN